ncbi:MAG: ABC transporter ATP-binding protein [Kaiparowitsia implicata GSE-PSE-MK54-09C]|jgi:putative spermidine/putrescine transport system ATP-binding protein|nr:ABC transporter ATP-binding protein [Kaiparowitsia implicata GSE-PSE-MK54-09C]
MSYLQLHHLQKAYGTVTAVHDISLDIEPGEFIALLGPSGCGKTTILRMIAGFEKPTQGAILLEGRDITRLPPSRRDMGMVFQSYSLFPHMTAAQNIAFGLRLKKLPTAQQRSRVQTMLELVGLEQMGDRFPHQLSGGQQQRVALARALAIAPRVLLLDEPLSALDARVRVQLRNEIRRIQQQLNITTLFVTHDQEEALSVSDRVVVMSQGHIEQAGTPEEIYLTPSTPFTASFIGAMNQIPGQWHQGRVRVQPKAPSTQDDRPEEWLQVQPTDLPDGTLVIVLVRPESIQILNEESAQPLNANLLSGLIASRLFLGSVVRLSLLIGDFYLKVDVPTDRADHHQLGQVVRLAFAAEQCRILPVEVEPTAPDVPSAIADGAISDSDAKRPTYRDR